ncbi:MAG: tRNA (N(6)-L-threonylcarbamoyladenosine(37)-C(2))-methylthiotransferase MtaB [Bacteroidetes bacterium]|nr:tRNA (N(6)-L-threonylcarbamoyladenosine(37)-C(2))-methylthiotransferase MtaB [Bacteroidota bacterium]
MATPRTVAFYTLGCKLNFSESSSLAQRFEASGYGVLPFSASADIYVINTCSVTDFADAKCRNIVRKAKRKNPESKIIVIGCYAQLKPKEIAQIEGVDLVLGAAEKFQVLDYIDQLSDSEPGWIQSGSIEEVHSFEQAFSFGDRTRSFLKVQDGCNYNCSFCTIPLARGKSRSPKIETITEQANKLAQKGVREVVLTGVNIGDYGWQDGEKSSNFLDLIRALDQVEGIRRFRISSIEPNLCSDEIIAFVAQSNRFVPHLHMPLQSGNNKQLAQMRRRYKRELYQDRVQQIKRCMPAACIGVDVITGFPGETEADFLESVDFIEKMPISYLHVFTYSERPNTLANGMSGSVPMAERKQRNKLLRQVSQKKKRAFYIEQLGTQRQVLIEEDRKEGRLTGFTENYVKVEINDSALQPNELIDVYLKGLTPEGRVTAEPILTSSLPY